MSELNHHLVTPRIGFSLRALSDGRVHHSFRRAYLLSRNPDGLAGNVKFCPGLLYPGIKNLRVKQSDWLPLFDLIVVVDKDFLYLAGDLRADHNADGPCPQRLLLSQPHRE
jgi:hypothetical protein